MNRRSLLLMAASFAAGPVLANVRNAPLVLSAGAPGGTYYPIAVGLSQLINSIRVPRTATRLAAISSSGSIENIQRLAEGDCDLAFAEGFFARKAVNQQGVFSDLRQIRQIRSLGALWPNVEHFVMRPRLSATGQLADLVDRDVRINLGVNGSGAQGSGQFLLESLGFDFERRPGVYYDDYSKSVKALVSGAVDLINLPGGVPVPAVTRAFKLTRGEVQIAQFSAMDAVQADGGLDLWQSVTLNPNAYPGQRDSVSTLAQSNELLGHADLDAAQVRSILSALYERGAFLSQVHPAAQGIQLAHAAMGLSFPLHPAAAEWFDERNVRLAAR